MFKGILSRIIYFKYSINKFSRYERELNAWQAITELQRERIVVEISDLVHRQLVTSALESDFRQHLEQNYLVRYLYLFNN
jgi:hypothetical protein